MEVIKDNNINNIEIYENDIDFYLKEFCAKQNIEDLRAMSQSVWNACLMYIQRNVFPDRNLLKQKENIYTENNIAPSNCNAYNYDLLNNICDYYIYITYLYDKECSIRGFSKLVNIHYSVFEEWGNNYTNSNRLGSSSLDIYKKLSSEREQSLVAKLVSMKHPTAMAIILNKDYGYNLPGVSRETDKKQALSVDQLPKLGQIAQNQEIKRIENQDVVVDIQ